MDPDGKGYHYCDENLVCYCGACEKDFDVSLLIKKAELLDESIDPLLEMLWCDPAHVCSCSLAYGSHRPPSDPKKHKATCCWRRLCEVGQAIEQLRKEENEETAI